MELCYQDSDSDGFATETVMISQDVICGNDTGESTAEPQQQIVMIMTLPFFQQRQIYQMMELIVIRTVQMRVVDKLTLTEMDTTIR